MKKKPAKKTVKKARKAATLNDKKIALANVLVKYFGDHAECISDIEACDFYDMASRCANDTNEATRALLGALNKVVNA